jgi:predicted peptidase
MYRTQSLIFSVILLAIFAIVSEGKTETGFLNRTMKIGATPYAYQVYVPADWTAKQKWPVVLFLHGAGERGADGIIQTEVGIGTAVRRRADQAKCVIVFPQCLKNRWWSEPEMQAQALKALELSVKEFRGDTNRLYLTGISMGGYGTWALASANPGKFAALAPVCGGIRVPAAIAKQMNMPVVEGDVYTPVAQKVGKTPVWIFHGGADPVVPVSESRSMNEALKAAGGNVKYTEYEGVSHNSWDKAYGEKEFFTWLLSQRLDARMTP